MDQTIRYSKEKLHKLNNFFMGPGHMLALYAFYCAFLGYWKWQDVLLQITLFYVSTLGITIGYHRFFTHRSFKCGKIAQATLLVGGGTALENSALSWVADHVTHHNETDKEKDPYNASRGFWHSHIGWILFKDPDKKQDYSAADHLKEDPYTWALVNFQHRHYIALAIFFSGIVPILITSLWSDSWRDFLMRGSFRFVSIVLSWHATFCINSLAHWKHWGSSQPYSRENTSQDSWWVSLFTSGEGYHNYHHAFPGDYRNGPLWYNFDPSKWIIFSLSKLGLVWKLNRVPDEKIQAARNAILKMA
ncbi:MAG: fatty acid desaturase [Patescibacteria group bacterium]